MYDFATTRRYKGDVPGVITVKVTLLRALLDLGAIVANFRKLLTERLPKPGCLKTLQEYFS